MYKFSNFLLLVFLIVFENSHLYAKSLSLGSQDALLFMTSVSGNDVHILISLDTNENYIKPEMLSLFKNTRLDKKPVDAGVATFTVNFNAVKTFPRHLCEEADLGFGPLKNTVFRVGDLTPIYPDVDIVLGKEVLGHYILLFSHEEKAITFQTITPNTPDAFNVPGEKLKISPNNSLTCRFIDKLAGELEGKIYLTAQLDPTIFTTLSQEMLRSILLPLGNQSNTRPELSHVSLGTLRFELQDLRVSKEHPGRIFLTPEVLLSKSWVWDIGSGFIRFL